MANECLEVIDKFNTKTICVVGDMILDKYTNGRIARISREAPVLVLDWASEKLVAGGAANVAHNVATLGGKVKAVGAVGHDTDAASLKKILTAASADINGLIEDKSRFTVSKNRIIAGGRATVSQQIVRIDKESYAPIDLHTEQKILSYLKETLSSLNGIVLSDYGSGTLSDNIVRFVTDEARRRGIPVMVDSRFDINRFEGVTYIKQNDAELAAAVGQNLEDEASIERAGRKLIAEMNADGILVTRGEQGMMLILKNAETYNIPVSDKSEVYDVSGAGDTCVAAFMLAISAGATLKNAVVLSNIAAGIAVRKLGTATVSAKELSSQTAKLFTVDY